MSKLAWETGTESNYTNLDFPSFLSSLPTPSGLSPASCTLLLPSRPRNNHLPLGEGGGCVVPLSCPFVLVGPVYGERCTGVKIRGGDMSSRPVRRLFPFFLVSRHVQKDRTRGNSS